MSVIYDEHKILVTSSALRIRGIETNTSRSKPFYIIQIVISSSLSSDMEKPKFFIAESLTPQYIDQFLKYDVHEWFATRELFRILVVHIFP